MYSRVLAFCKVLNLHIKTIFKTGFQLAEVQLNSNAKLSKLYLIMLQVWRKNGFNLGLLRSKEGTSPKVEQ